MNPRRGVSRGCSRLWAGGRFFESPGIGQRAERRLRGQSALHQTINRDSENAELGSKRFTRSVSKGAL
jgi:hypothetical protein